MYACSSLFGIWQTTLLTFVFAKTVCYSDDFGKTWQFLSQPEGKNPPNGLWEPFMRVAHDGSLQLYYSRENSQTDQDIVQHISKDNGKTWGAMVTIAGATTNGRDGMPGITEFDTGSGKQLLCIFETTQDGPFHVKSVTSDDDGITWGNRLVVYVPTGTNNNAGSPQVATLGGNVLVAIFMTDEDLSPHNWFQGAGVKSLVSTDGVNWTNKLSVSPPQSNWPGIVPLNDNEFITIFDHAGGVQSQALKLS
jgi:BNR repeat-like domain